MTGWLDILRACDRDGTQAVIVTLAEIRGSVPREAGTKMIVTEDAVHGTIGGGALEFSCIDVARRMLVDAASAAMRQFPLGPALGQCCGGHVSVLFEPIRPPALDVAVFGAGHVGRALITLLGTIDCRVRWIDSREEAHPAMVPGNVTAIVAADPASEIAALRAGSRVLIMTHDHQLDYAITHAALARGEFPMVGLIGSKTKRARFARRLGALAERLVCPIGIAGVGGKAPAEIAIAVAAQILLGQQGQAIAVNTETACEGCAACP